MIADQASGLPDGARAAWGTPEPWLLDSVLAAVDRSATTWRVAPAEDSFSPWILAEPAQTTIPEQGWKLHVASYASGAATTLRAALPALIDADVAFKVVGSIEWLRVLNEGTAG